VNKLLLKKAEMDLPADNTIDVHSKLREIVIPAFISVIGTFIPLFPSNPTNMTLPSRDSGVFLYMGWRFLSGDIPYKDV